MSFLETKLAAYFRSLDLDNNGAVDRSEFIAPAYTLGALVGFEPHSERVQTMVRTRAALYDRAVAHADANQDGKLQFNEFVAFFIALRDLILAESFDGSHETMGWLKGLWAAVAGAMDQDGDGHVGHGEWLNWLRSHGIQGDHEDAWYALSGGQEFISRERVVQLCVQFFLMDNEALPGTWLHGSLR